MGMPIRLVCAYCLESVESSLDEETLASTACPSCEVVLNEPLDLAAFCWAEVEARAPRLMAEVHTLASHYGWSEADILAMSRVRRNAYLGMVLS